VTSPSERRRLPPLTDELRPFVEAGVLGPAEVHVASSFVRHSPTPMAPEVVLGAALAVRGLSSGHTCVVLSTVASTVGVDGTDPDLLVALPWPEPARWIQAIEDSPMVDQPPGTPHEGTVLPLIWDSGRLYLRRYWLWERSVADGLRARAGQIHTLGTDASPILDRLLGPPDRAEEPNRQRLAVEVGLARTLAVIAGGPGTGKTRTVARLLASLHELSGSHPPEVALAAPTGKAAARMTEALRHELSMIEVSDRTALALERTEAQTIHRLLGSYGSGFRHDHQNPLGHELVVVDETSMVSLPLMARLLDALRPEARLVLVGDPDQLTSVEAGTVMGDIVGAVNASTNTGLEDSVVRLQRVHRFGSDSPIARLAGAVRSGDVDHVLAQLKASATGADAEVTRLDPTDDTARAMPQEESAQQASTIIDAARRGDAPLALSLLSARRVLCANRRGPDGVERWSAQIEQAVERLGLTTRGRWYAGRPILVTRNDYTTRRSNGDVGVTVADPDRGSGRDDLVVAFDDGALVDPTRLDEIETLWAMTIHKSQGSEFDDVVIVLPPPPSPILTRELLYTAVTRARRSVTIVATEESIRACVNRPVSRSSGLRHALDPR